MSALGALFSNKFFTKLFQHPRLTSRKTQTKVLSAHYLGVTQDITEISFYNLEIGKWYELSGQVTITARSGNDSFLNFLSDVGGGGSWYGRQQIRAQNTPASIVSAGVNLKFKAESSIMISRVSGVGTDGVQGNSTKAMTFLTLTESEADDFTETTDFS